MKRLILSEGHNDTIFLKEMLINKLVLFKKDEVLFFDQNPEELHEPQKFIEDRYFKKLDSHWLTYKLLAKSEGGKSKILSITISQFVYLCKKRYNPIILIDLDGSSIEKFAETFKTQLEIKFKCIKLKVKVSEECKMEDALMYSMRLWKYDRIIGTIYIIAFIQSLEATAGIDKKMNYSDEQKRNVFQTYINRSQIHKMFHQALSN